MRDWVEEVVDVPEYLLVNLLPADSNVLMSGKAKKAYKSWLAFQMALCIATGVACGPLVPRETAGLPVLILEAEGGRAQTRNRWIYLANGNKFDLKEIDNLYFSHREPILLDDPDWVRKIGGFITQRGIKFLVVDPLVMFSRADENNVKEMSKVMRALTEFRQTGATTLFLHHLNKPQKDYEKDIDDEIRGTSAIGGFYDSHFAIRQRQTINQNRNDLIVRAKDDEERHFEIEWFIDKHKGHAIMRMEEADSEARLERLADQLMEVFYLADDGLDKGRIKEIIEEDPEPVIDFMLGRDMIEKSGRMYRLAKGPRPMEDSYGNA